MGLRQELKLLRYKTPMITQSTCTQPFQEPITPFQELKDDSHLKSSMESTQEMPRTSSIPSFGDMYQKGSELSVQVHWSRTNLGDLVKFFMPGSGATPGPRSLEWLNKMLHGIIASKMSNDAVDMSLDLPMSSYAAFCADWMRKRFAVFLNPNKTYKRGAWPNGYVLSKP